MVSTTTIVRNAQRASTLQEWWDTKSAWYSRLCGEEFTHGEVINVHVGIVAMFLMGALLNALATWLEGGAI